MPTDQITEFLRQLRSGNLDAANPEFPDQLSAAEFLKQVRGHYPIVFQERFIGRKAEYSLARSLQFELAVPRNGQQMFPPVHLFPVFRRCLLISTYDDYVSGIALAKTVRIRPSSDDREQLVVSMGSGYKLDRMPDGWVLKSRGRRSTVLSEAGDAFREGFSSAGRRTDDDERNSLVKVFATIVARRRPVAFVFENVEGFLTGARGRFVIDLLKPVVDAGYHVHLRKVNAANYGVAQHRKRVIAIGGLRWEPSFPGPTHSAHGAPGAALASRVLPPTPSLADALASLPPPVISGPPPVADHVAKPLSGDDLERAKLLRAGQPCEICPSTFGTRAIADALFVASWTVPRLSAGAGRHQACVGFALTSRRRRLPGVRCATFFTQMNTGHSHCANARDCKPSPIRL